MFENKFFKSKIWHAGAALFYLLIGLKLFAVSAEFLASKPATPRVERGLLCEKTVFEELDSPDHKLMAILQMVDCGATTNWQSSIQVMNREVGKTYGGLFDLNGRPDGLTMKWANNYTLEISGFAVEDLRGLRQENRSGAKIVLRLEDIEDEPSVPTINEVRH